MTSLKTSIKTITYLSDIGCLEIQGASLMTDEESPIEIKDNNPISNGEYLTTEDESHAVKVDDGVTGYINNASVMTSGDGSYGISVDSQNKVLYISDSDIKTSGSVSDKENGGITASAVVSEFGGTIFMNGDNSVESGGAYSAGLLSQVNDSEKMVNNTRLETTDKTNIVTSGEKCSRCSCMFKSWRVSNMCRCCR